MPEQRTENPIRAATYSRVSTFLQKAKGRSLDDQDAVCERYAAEIGAVIVGRYEDTDSGADWNLPGLNDMLDAAGRGEFDVLICPEPDRFARSVVKSLTIEAELRRSGVRLDYARFRLEDSAEGQLLKTQLAAFAEYEKAKIAFRTARGRAAKAAAGLVVGIGPAPYGYRYTYNDDGKVNGLELDPVTAPIARRIVRELAHRTADDVAADLNAENIPSPVVMLTERRRHQHDKPRQRVLTELWSSASLRSLIRQPAYRHGHITYGTSADGTPITAIIPRIVTEAELQAALDGLASRRWHHTNSRRRYDVDPYELRGLLVCGQCGHALAAESAGDGHGGVYRYYTCLSTTPKRAAQRNAMLHVLPRMLAAAAEQLVWETIGQALMDEALLSEGIDGARRTHEAAIQRRREHLAHIDGEIARLRRRLDRATADRLDAEPGSETEASLKRTIIETEREIIAHQRERAQLDQTGAAPGLSESEAEALRTFAADVRAGLPHATRDERRQIYGLLKLKGTVRQDRDAGARIGRNRFVIEWDAVIDLPDIRDRDGSFVDGHVQQPIFDAPEVAGDDCLVEVDVPVLDHRLPARMDGEAAHHPALRRQDPALKRVEAWIAGQRAGDVQRAVRLHQRIERADTTLAVAVRARPCVYEDALMRRHVGNRTPSGCRISYNRRGAACR
jgi:site-specific DNA recombinase